MTDSLRNTPTSAPLFEMRNEAAIEQQKQQFSAIMTAWLDTHQTPPELLALFGPLHELPRDWDVSRPLSDKHAIPDGE